MARTAAAAAEAEVIDAYTLLPNELTKEQVAEKAGVSLRAVEKWKAEGKLRAHKTRKRIPDPNTGKPVIKQVLIFMQDDVETFFQERDAPAEPAMADRASAETALAARGKTQDLQMALIAGIARSTGLLPSDRKPFIPIALAAAEYDLSVSGIKQLIDSNTLDAFPGPHGKVMVSRRQIESL
jgi:hypothetical protein